MVWFRAMIRTSRTAILNLGHLRKPHASNLKTTNRMQTARSLKLSKPAGSASQCRDGCTVIFIRNLLRPIAGGYSPLSTALGSTPDHLPSKAMKQLVLECQTSQLIFPNGIITNETGNIRTGILECRNANNHTHTNGNHQTH